jgi:hypothetical protein
MVSRKRNVPHVTVCVVSADNKWLVGVRDIHHLQLVAGNDVSIVVLHRNPVSCASARRRTPTSDQARIKFLGVDVWSGGYEKV